MTDPEAIQVIRDWWYSGDRYRTRTSLEHAKEICSRLDVGGFEIVRKQPSGVMRAAERAADTVAGWSQSKQDYAQRALGVDR